MDDLVVIAPLFQTDVNVVLIGVQQASSSNHLRQHRFDGHLLNIRKHLNHHVTRALKQRDRVRDTAIFLAEQRKQSDLYYRVSVRSA
jgi:hypothetical protein